MEYIIKGDIATFNDQLQIIEDGYIAIKDQKINHVFREKNDIPARLKNFPIINVDGFIYPGLIDLHNHLPYNYLKLWNIDKKFETRYQWPRLTRYRTEISYPTKLLANSNPAELVKYSEIKSMIGGVTSIDGYSKFNKSYSAWLLRNIEVEPFGNMEPKIYQSVMRLKPTDFITVKNKMKKGNGFIYHLAEGTSQTLLEEFDELDKNQLITKKLIAVHCNALTSDHWEKFGKKHTKFVWSPLSNLLLYGTTADLISAKKNNILISLGSDWSPTGSKSLLWELKVANIYNKKILNGLFSSRELVQMTISNPCKSLGLDDRTGSIQNGLFADLVVFDKTDQDPYENLIKSTEKNMKLSIIDGRPRYGNSELLSKFNIQQYETISIGQSIKKGIDILEPNVEYGDITFKEVKHNLSSALKNPEKSIKKTIRKYSEMKTLGEEPLRLIIEDEFSDEFNQPIITKNLNNFDLFFKDNFKDGISKSLKLDKLSMLSEIEFFKTLENNPNIPDELNNLKELKNYL